MLDVINFEAIKGMGLKGIIQGVEYYAGNVKLMKELKPISSRTLSLKLKKLQERGLIKRKVIDSQPIKIEYEITEQGRDLKKALIHFGNWFVKHHT